VNRKASSLDPIVLIALCAIGIFLGRQQSAARTLGKADPVTALVQSAVEPVARPLRNSAQSSSDFFSGLFAARRLTEENRRLAALAASADLYSQNVERMQLEIDSLRKLSGFGPLPGKTRVPADVIGYFPKENRITLNVGSKSGIKVGLPVQAPEGLVGTVQVVEPNQCQVLLLTSNYLKIGALDASRNPAPAGLIQGENSTTLTLPFQDPQAPVEIGDKITTNGASLMIPGGIPIGRVIAVHKDEVFGVLNAQVDPAVSVGALREVHVLR